MPGADQKKLTLRVDAALAAEFERVAAAEGLSVNKAASEALARHIAEKREDPEFQASLRRMMDEQREILDRLSQ